MSTLLNRDYNITGRKKQYRQKTVAFRTFSSENAHGFTAAFLTMRQIMSEQTKKPLIQLGYGKVQYYAYITKNIIQLTLNWHYATIHMLNMSAGLRFSRVPGGFRRPVFQVCALEKINVATFFQAFVHIF